MRSPIRPSSPARRARALAVAGIVFAVILLVPPGADPASADEAAAPAPDESTAPRWIWPGGVPEVVRAFEAPENPYGPGHRGIDVAVSGDDILAPDDGVVAFRGVVVDRPLITIDHGGGLVSTLEPVESDLSPGAPVAQGSVVGTLAEGGHTPAGGLHLGARLDGEYINPLALLGALERPVLLPCCG